MNRPEQTRTKRDPVPMARIHVRLDFEHEPGEALVSRMHRSGIGRSRLRRGSELDERPQKRLEAEIRECAAEEHRSLPAGEVLGRIE